MLAGMWYFFALIMIASYTANLVNIFFYSLLEKLQVYFASWFMKMPKFDHV